MPVLCARDNWRFLFIIFSISIIQSCCSSGSDYVEFGGSASLDSGSLQAKETACGCDRDKIRGNVSALSNNANSRSEQYLVMKCTFYGPFVRLFILLPFVVRPVRYFKTQFTLKDYVIAFKSLYWHRFRGDF